jgi:FkbM family methyltransferase
MPDMSIPTIIHFTIPERPSEHQLRNIETARALHPGWNVIVWQDPIDGTNFTLSKYWHKTNSGAQLADLIRLEVVYQQGGFYLDSDFALRKSLDPLRRYACVVASQDGNVLTNAFFGAAPNSPALKRLIDVLDLHEVDWDLPPNATTGPSLFTREMAWRDDVTVIPRETFYPYDWNERPKAPRLWTYGAHEWEHSWKYSWGSAKSWRQPFRSARHTTKLTALNVRRRIYAKLRDLILGVRRRLRVYRPEPYPASGTICAQTIHGPRIYLFGEDASITPEIALHGTYEFQEERFIQRVLRAGDWAIDVGANVGAFALLMAQSVGPCGRVYCYEPNPLPAALLKKSLAMNWFHDRTEVRPHALGSERGTQRLRFAKGRMGDATLAAKGADSAFHKTTPLVGAEEEISVETSTLDDDFPVNLPIRLLKIDAEGFEHHVLRGGGRLLDQHCVDILMLECIQEVYGPSWHEYLREIEKLIAHGYGLYILRNSAKLRPLNIKGLQLTDRGRNIILVSQEAKETINELS